MKSSNVYAPKDNYKILKQKTMMIIDNDDELLSFNRELLEFIGYQVWTSRNGNEALDLLSEVTEPSLILLDYELADMDGSKFISLLEKRHPQILQVASIVFRTRLPQIPSNKVLGVIPNNIGILDYIRTVSHFYHKAECSCGSKTFPRSFAVIRGEKSKS